MVKKLKLFVTIILVIFILSEFAPKTQADDVNEEIQNNFKIDSKTVQTATEQVNIPNINSRAAVVIDRNSNTILYGKNEKAKRKMASTTKIMTCLLVIENCNLDETINISKKSAGTGGSRLGLRTNDKITVKDLLYGLMLCSGNDTAVALAEHVGGSIEGFATIMNKRAKELGLKNTNFETPHGLDKDNHYTTAYELALLSNIALNNKTFAKIVSTKSYTVNINGYPKTILNTNELLGNLNGVYGIKTGFTNGANRCLVTACKRNDLDIICVVLGADTKKFRTNDSIKLIEYTFKTFKSVRIERLVNENFNNWKQKNINSFNIIKGKSQNISLCYNKLRNEIFPIKKDLVNDINIFITCKTKLEAPVKANTPLGIIEVYAGDTFITSSNIYLDCNIDKKNIFDYFKYFYMSYNKVKFIQ